MRWDEIGDVTCSVARSLSVVGDRCTMLVLRDVFLGVRRFDEFQKRIGATRHRLADRLRKLVASGILERVRYQERPVRFEYRLTEKGLDLYPMIVSLTRWGDRWMAGKAGSPVELVHETCGKVTMPSLACPECGEHVGARDMVARAGPALRARLARYVPGPERGVSMRRSEGCQGRRDATRVASRRPSEERSREGGEHRTGPVRQHEKES
jgi:DNA-binding HxlR family transcriptional regulator